MSDSFIAGIKTSRQSSIVTRPLTAMPTTFLGSPSMISIIGCCSNSPRLVVLLLELDLELADQRLLRAIYVREHLPLSPDIFEAGIDELARSPNPLHLHRL